MVWLRHAVTVRVAPSASKGEASMPTVSVVTPSKKNSKGIIALQNELENGFGWGTVAGWSFPIHSVVDDGVPLATCATNAFNDHPDVIVTSGTMATNAVLPLTKTIPIIQAVGGALPASPQMNVTGFLIDAKQISQRHFAKLAANHAKVTVLYDNTNTPSSDAYEALKAYRTAYFPGVQIKAINIAQLNTIEGSFMLIPNASFHLKQNRLDIATAVMAVGVPAIYPEREYKKEHNNQAGIMVHGHNVAATYRLAGSYVDSILSGTMDASSLPPFKEAVADKHEDI
jgi:hypothetical protein